MNDEFLWVERFRPKTIADTILPDNLKAKFQTFVDQNNIPNLILSGTAGIGKTTVARAMLEELDCDYIVINGSMNGGIDTLRNEISTFASSVSLMGGRKYVILDEADYINPNSTQPALRNFMEEFSKNCGFIFTCNFLNKIISPLHSRCSVIDFAITKKDAPKMAQQFYKRVLTILDAEKITYDKRVVGELVQKFYPDWRRTLNELQGYAASGTIDSGILANQKDLVLSELVSLMKDKNFTGCKHWLKQNLDSDPNALLRAMYDATAACIKPEYGPSFTVLLAEYQYKAAFVADAEINIAGFIGATLLEVEFL